MVRLERFLVLVALVGSLLTARAVVTHATSPQNVAQATLWNWRK